MSTSFLSKWNQPAGDSARDLGWAVRLGFFTITVILAFLTFWLALCVPLFALHYENTLGGKPLPALTAFILARPMAWVISAFLVPAVALIFAILVKRHAVAVAGISLATLVFLIEVFCIAFGIWLPLISFPTGMQAIP